MYGESEPFVEAEERLLEDTEDSDSDVNKKQTNVPCCMTSLHDCIYILASFKNILCVLILSIRQVQYFLNKSSITRSGLC